MRSLDAAAHLSELEALAASKDNLTLHIQNSATDGRATADSILAKTGLTTERLTVAFCGPAIMRKALIAGFQKQGLASRRFQYEEFEIRTGIGLRRLGNILFERATRARHS